MEYQNLTEEEKELYGKIEHLITIWNLDGSKTAGSLTREIIDLLISKDK